MEKLPTAKLEKRSPKSTKKNPLKVVYISNPMKIKATPSEFRAVVQQFTGRHANSPPPEGLATIVNRDNDNEEAGVAGGGYDHQEKWQCNMDSRCGGGSDISYEYGRREDQVMDDMITSHSQMLESFPPLLPSDFGSS